MDIRVKYFNTPEDMRLKAISKGNWLDVRVNRVERNGELIEWSNEDEVAYMSGDVVKVYLGFAMELPTDVEALLCPRSSTFKNYGLIQTNSVGVIDTSFNGDGDEWAIMFYALRDGEVKKYDRVAQFRVIDRMRDINLEVVEKLGNKDRGAYGSTGVR